METDLQLVVEQFSFVMIDNGGIVRTWREKVGEKYSNLPGIRDLHDFLTIAVPPNKIVMKVREKCYILEVYVILLQRSRKTSSVQIHAFRELQIRTKQGGILDL